ncbi:MAG TPA: GYF domain-containing protein [Bacteroidia bacterium]|nr:GYF domain-containing protein [Bacteroidia bacterium]
MKTYWLAKPGADAQGPFTFEQIAARWKSGDATADMLVMPVDGSEWTALSRAMGAIADGRAARTSAIVYRVMALLLGWLGAHDFYAGKALYGYAKMFLLAVGVLASRLPDLMPVSGIALLLLVGWVLVDLIRGPGRR